MGDAASYIGGIFLRFNSLRGRGILLFAGCPLAYFKALVLVGVLCHNNFIVYAQVDTCSTLSMITPPYPWQYFIIRPKFRLTTTYIMQSYQLVRLYRI